MGACCSAQSSDEQSNMQSNTIPSSHMSEDGHGPIGKERGDGKEIAPAIVDISVSPAISAMASDETSKLSTYKQHFITPSITAPAVVPAPSPDLHHRFPSYTNTNTTTDPTHRHRDTGRTRHTHGIVEETVSTHVPQHTQTRHSLDGIYVDVDGDTELKSRHEMSIVSGMPSPQTTVLESDMKQRDDHDRHHSGMEVMEDDDTDSEGQSLHAHHAAITSVDGDQLLIHDTPQSSHRSYHGWIKNYQYAKQRLPLHTFLQVEHAFKTCTLRNDTSGSLTLDHFTQHFASQFDLIGTRIAIPLFHSMQPNEGCIKFTNLVSALFTWNDSSKHERCKLLYSMSDLSGMSLLGKKEIAWLVECISKQKPSHRILSMTQQSQSKNDEDEEEENVDAENEMFVDQLFLKIDRDYDNRITLAEWLRFAESFPTLDALLDQFDPNIDQHLNS